MRRKDEISAAKAYLATIEREKRAKRARDEFRKYRKGAEKAVSTLPGRYEDLPRKTLDKIERDENALLDKRVRNERQAKKNRARYEKKFKDEERNLPKDLPFESTGVHKARLALAKRVLEGMSTGWSASQTGHRVGRFIGQKETDKAADLPAKKRQAKRIAKKVAKRQADLFKKHNRPEDPDLVHDSAFERFKKNYYKGKAFTGPEKENVAGPGMIKKLQPWRKR